MNCQPTPSQMLAHVRRTRFRIAIERRHAELQASKSAPRFQLSIQPEVVPAECGPPKIIVPAEPPPVLYPTMEHILKVVASAFTLRPHDLRSACRTADVVRARQIACYLCRHLTPHSFPMIGTRLGDRDHTTVLHAVRKVGAKLRVDEDLAFDVAILFERITGVQQ
jgi:hypothetical protein